MRHAALIPTLAAVALLGAGCAATPSSAPEAALPAANTPATPSMIGGDVVSAAEEGFAPATLTVKAGTTVTFRNDSTRSIWPASAVHPTHDELPGFDAGRAVPPGESYQYTFTKPGTWKFHDHLNPTRFGQVVVTE